MIYEGEESMSRILRIPVGAPSAPPISNDNYILNENNQSNLENINFEAKSVLDNVRKEVLPTKQENKTLNGSYFYFKLSLLKNNLIYWNGISRNKLFEFF